MDCRDAPSQSPWVTRPPKKDLNEQRLLSFLFVVLFTLSITRLHTCLKVFSTAVTALGDKIKFTTTLPQAPHIFLHFLFRYWKKFSQAKQPKNKTSQTLGPCFNILRGGRCLGSAVTIRPPIRWDERRRVRSVPPGNPP